MTSEKWIKQLVLLALAAKIVRPNEEFQIWETWDGYIAIGRKHG